MEVVYALAIGVLSAAGVWLLLRPRTFQVIIGLSLLSYATNLFIFGMGRLSLHRAPSRRCCSGVSSKRARTSSASS